MPSGNSADGPFAWACRGVVNHLGRMGKTASRELGHQRRDMHQRGYQTFFDNLDCAAGTQDTINFLDGDQSDTGRRSGTNPLRTPRATTEN